MDRSVERGFSLIELIAVLAALSLLLGASALGYEAIAPRWRLRAAAGEVASTLLAARSRAALGRIEVAVVFDSASGRYVIATAGTPTPTVLPPTRKLPPGISFARPDTGPAVTTRPPGTTDEAALFSPRGQLRSLSLPGVVYLADLRHGHYRRIAVEASGRVRLEEWMGGTWASR